MAEESCTPVCGHKRKSFERGDIPTILPNKKFQSPLVITAPDGRTATKSKSRLPLVGIETGPSEDQIKQQFLSRINQAESLLTQKRFSSQDVLGSLYKAGFTTPRKLRNGPTTPNPFSFMTPKNNTEKGRESLNGRRESVSARRYSSSSSSSSSSSVSRRDSLAGKTVPSTQLKVRVPGTGRKMMRMQASVQLKVAESQEFEASRIAHVKREIWMDRQERAYSVWLNDLLRQPMDANAKVLPVGSGQKVRASADSFTRSSNYGTGMGSLSFDREMSQARYSMDGSSGYLSNLPWWTSFDETDNHETLKGTNKQNRRIVSKGHMSSLRNSRESKGTESSEVHQETHLSQICSASELRRRLGPYLEVSKLERVMSTMTQVARHIDDGRLRMKPNCVILSDIALRQKALDVLSSYTPAWLRLGLVIVLGTIALTEQGEKQTDAAFLRVLVEEHFLFDSTLAKQFSTNRAIDGLYRDGYKEALGNLILKRIFLLILVLDKMKCEMALNTTYGIDGMDGGSPILFQPNGIVKSSRQALEEFLSHVMQGEGDLIVHVGKLGYHVSHVQAPLCEYNFEVRNLVEDLQDGIRLCRLAQLMSHDLSILAKIKLPCHMPKKRAHNCEVAIESLSRSGVLMQDEQGAPITAEHIASGQREKALSLMWNVILQLQIPRLVSHPKLFEEVEHLGLVIDPETKGYSALDLLLAWVQGISSNFCGTTVENFTTSFADGQVLCYLISNYLPQCLPHHAIKVTSGPTSDTLMSLKVNVEKITGEHGRWELQNFRESGNYNMSDREATTHNFRMVEEAAKMLGIGHEVLTLSDVVDEDPCTFERNMIIFVAHLCSALLNVNPEDFQPLKCVVPTYPTQELNFNLEEDVQVAEALPQQTLSIEYDIASRDIAATCIQKYFRGCSERSLYQKRLAGVKRLQAHVRGRQVRTLVDCIRDSVLKIQCSWRGHCVRKLVQEWSKAATLIQSAWRRYHTKREYKLWKNSTIRVQAVGRGYLVRRRSRELRAAVLKIQSCWRGFAGRREIWRTEFAALLIQKNFRGYFQRKSYKLSLSRTREATVKIQAAWRGYYARGALQNWEVAATHIQRCFRGYLQRKQYSAHKICILKIQALARGREARKYSAHYKEMIVRLQVRWRGCCTRRQFKTSRLAATLIQSSYRSFVLKRLYHKERKGIIRIQALVRGRLLRQRVRLCHEAATKIQACWHGSCARKAMIMWRIAATNIQSHYRGHVQRNSSRCVKMNTIQDWLREGHDCHERPQEVLCCSDNHTTWTTQDHRCTVAASTVQAYWRGYCVRKLSLLFTENLNPVEPKMPVQVYSVHELAAGQTLTRWARTLTNRLHFLRLRKASMTIQKYYRGHKVQKHYVHVMRCICIIQAVWKGHKWRTGQSRVKQHMQELRLRMQSTAATVDNSQRLGNRLMEALAQLLSQKTVSGILHTCATIDVATEHSKQCCEWLVEGGAISKLLQLIPTINRSPPHEQVLKHALSILANLARFPSLAFSIASEMDSTNIIVEQLLIFRNKEEVLSKAMNVLQHICCTPGCVDIIQKDTNAMRRMQNVVLMLEKKFEVDKRNLEKLPPSTHLPTRKAAERKLRETSQHHQSILSIMPGKLAKKPLLPVSSQRNSGPSTTGRPRDSFSNNGNSGNSSIDRRQGNLNPKLSGAKKLEEKKRDNPTTSQPRIGCNFRRESMSAKQPWGVSSAEANKSVIPTPKVTTTLITTELNPCTNKKESMSTSTRTSPPRSKSGVPLTKSSTQAHPQEPRISQSRIPRVPLKDRSNCGTKQSSKLR